MEVEPQLYSTMLYHLSLSTLFLPPFSLGLVSLLATPLPFCSEDANRVKVLERWPFLNLPCSAWMPLHLIQHDGESHHAMKSGSEASYLVLSETETKMDMMSSWFVWMPILCDSLHLQKNQRCHVHDGPSMFLSVSPSFSFYFCSLSLSVRQSLSRGGACWTVTVILSLCQLMSARHPHSEQGVCVCVCVRACMHLCACMRLCACTLDLIMHGAQTAYACTCSRFSSCERQMCMCCSSLVPLLALLLYLFFIVLAASIWATC